MCTENLTDQTGCPFRIQMTEPFRMDLPLQYLRNARLTFVSWERDTAGSTTGMKVLCDLGHGYGFDNGEKAVVLWVGEEYSFIHEYTDTGEGGSDWEDGSFRVTVRLIPASET